jgi:hypothetical protein
MGSFAGAVRRAGLTAAEQQEASGRRSRPAPGAAAGTPLFLQKAASSCGPSCPCAECEEAKLPQTEPPVRQAERPSVEGARCTSVLVELPGRIVFLGDRGSVAASLTTTVPPGNYGLTYSPSEGRFDVSSLRYQPAEPPRFEVSRPSDEALFAAYRASVTRQGTPLRIVGGTVGQPAIPDVCISPAYVEALDDAELDLHADVYRVRLAALGEGADFDTMVESLHLVQTEQLRRQAQDLTVVGETGRPPVLPGSGSFVLQPANNLPAGVAAAIPEGALVTLPTRDPSALQPAAGGGLGGDSFITVIPLGADLQPLAAPDSDGWGLRPTDVTTPLATGSRTMLQSVNAGLMQQGFAAAGPDAIGLVGIPRWFTPGARVPEAVLDTWGHTALYVRQGGRVTTVLGFNPQMGGSQLLPFLRNAGAVESGTAAVPATIGADAYLFTVTGARSIEYPVSSATAEALMSRLPSAGPVAPGGATPPLYTARPAVYQVCTGSNCVLWAAEEAEAVLGGYIGPASRNVSVTALGEGGSVAARTASQGRFMQFVRGVQRGEPAIVPPAATGPPVAAGMSRGLQALKWGGRVFFVIGLATIPLEVLWAPSGQKGRTAVGATAGFLGGLAAGAAAGLVCGPGAPICSIVLGLTFGIAGALGARALAESIYDALAALSDSPGSILAPPSATSLALRGGYRGLLRSPADLQAEMRSRGGR